MKLHCVTSLPQFSVTPETLDRVLLTKNSLFSENLQTKKNTREIHRMVIRVIWSTEKDI